MKELQFDFWKENKTANHFQLTTAQLENRFTDWLKTQDINYLALCPAQRCILSFITDKEGLNSVFEKKQYGEIHRYLSPLIDQYLDTIK